ncbi:MAG: metallophosphoesterase [Planctomycetes bacterium]|nr:metallophosphoesterase [Planctomycetota bacterium]
MKFLHTSDLHLGSAFLGMSPERARERREDLKQILRNVVTQANDHAVDLIIVAGDLFADPEPPAPLVDFVAYTLRPDAFHRRTVVLLAAGDADGLRAESPYLTAEFPKNFVVVRSTDWTEFRAAVEGVRLMAVSADAERPERNVLASLPGRYLEDDLPTLAVAHASWDTPGFIPPGFCPFAEADLEALAGIDYLALGGAHEVRQVSSRPVTYYPGAPEPVFADQANLDCCVLLGELTGRGAVNVKPIALNVRDLRRIELDVSHCRADADVLELAKRHADRRSILSLVLRGAPAADWCPDLDRIEEELAPAFFAVDVAAELQLPPDPGAAIGTVLGDFTARCRRDLEALGSEPGEEADVAQAALRFGVAALHGKES